MTKLLAQHGAAKGKKIDIAMESGFLEGVIFAPREERIVSIFEYCNKSNELNRTNTFLDPQLYYSTFDGDIFKYLESGIDYPVKITRRDWRKKSPELMTYLETHAKNSEIISDSLITPGFYIQNLDWRFDYCLDIYQYCYETYNFKRYYLSLLIDSSFFHSKSDVDEMLEDIIENIDNKDGIYLTICNEKTQEKNYEYFDAQNLANILYFIYTLQRNGFKIATGYTFVNSVLFAMLNTEYVASGWFNNIRKFSKDRFEETESMGRRKKRYLSLPLYTYITFEDINNVKNLIDGRRLLSGCNIDNLVLDNQDSISFVDLEQQYWQALSIKINEINELVGLSNKITFLLDDLNEAKSLYGEILDKLKDNKEAYNRIKTNSKHLDSWIMGIETFKNRISLL